ncbi:MAG TPA: hypothetical protein VGC63_04745 [Solirubrobacterales bacterium]
MAEPLTRSALDRLTISAGGAPVHLGCTSHPEAGNTAIYQDGCLRLLCRQCGFEATKVKVADRG